MYKHEPIASHERCVGNTQKGEPYVAWLRENGVTSARLGSVALDIYGKRLPPEHYRPIIIAEFDADKYDAVMMREFSKACRN